MDSEVIDFPDLRLEIQGALATIVLNDPGRLNAISKDMATSLVAALREIAKPRRGVRCLMLTGEARGFCAGVNMVETRSTAESAKGPPPLRLVETLINPMIRVIKEVSVPIVAAVNGPCVGVGVVLALLADHVIASDQAYFLLPYRNLATCCDAGITWLLPRAIGSRRARQMLLRAERVSAETALTWGLVDDVVPEADFRAAARTVACEFAEGPTVALSLMRRLLIESDGTSFDAQLEAEARGVRITARTKDNAAGIRAFGSRTKPVFIGA